MEYLRPSREAAFVRPVTACLVEVYGEEFGRGAWAEIDPLLMIRPPRGFWLFMILKASCVHRKTPVRLMSTTVFHCSYVRSSRGTGGAPVPALLNTTSRRPNTSTVFANSAFTAAGSATSVGTTSVGLLASAAVASRRSWRRPARTTE